MNCQSWIRKLHNQVYPPHLNRGKQLLKPVLSRVMHHPDAVFYFHWRSFPLLKTSFKQSVCSAKITVRLLACDVTKKKYSKIWLGFASLGLVSVRPLTSGLLKLFGLNSFFLFLCFRLIFFFFVFFTSNLIRGKSRPKNGYLDRVKPLALSKERRISELKPI